MGGEGGYSAKVEVAEKEPGQPGDSGDHGV